MLELKSVVQNFLGILLINTTGYFECIYIKMNVEVATANRSMNKGQPLIVPCPLVSGVRWMMWWGSP